VPVQNVEELKPYPANWFRGSSDREDWRKVSASTSMMITMKMLRMIMMMSMMMIMRMMMMIMMMNVYL
jgi:hypothetical protein